MYFVFVFFKQKTAYDMRISDWSSDVCSSDLNKAQRSEDLRSHPDEDEIAQTGAGLNPDQAERDPEERIGDRAIGDGVVAPVQAKDRCRRAIDVEQQHGAIDRKSVV